jgi:branched-chain amino acid transport system substrate-binding protein
MRTGHTTARKRRTAEVAGVLMLALVAASCSSDSTASTTTAAATPTTVATSAATETTEVTEVTSAETTEASSDNTTDATTEASIDTTTDETAEATTEVTDDAATDALGAPNAASGDPILIGTINEGGSDAINEQSENTLSGIQIAAKYANEYLGGIAGHPIEIVSCGNKATPAGATDCANQMIEKKINAYVMPYSAQESVIVNILAPTGIPMVLGSAASAEALTTPGVFAITGGYPATLGAFAIDAKAKGFTKFSMITVDVPAATAGATALGGITFKKEGVTFEVVAVAPGTPDMSPQLQAAISGGADVLGVTGDASFCSSFLQAYQTLGLSVPKYVIAPCVAPTVIGAVPDALNGSYVATPRAPGPDDAVYAATVAKYGDGDIDPDPAVSSGVADGWGSMMGLVNAMQGYTGPIDSASLTAQIKAAKDIPIPLSGGLTATCDGTAIPIIANVCSGGINIAEVDSEGTLSNFEKLDAAEAYAP